MTIFFTSDQHFGHKNILTFGKGRPFSSVEDMQQGLIDKWNNKVKEEDTVYILGDFCWGFNSKKIKELMSQLNGKKILIAGNHDRLNDYYKSASFQDIFTYHEVQIDGERIILCHFPIAEWNGYYYGAYHLYGHTHGTFNLALETLGRERPNGNCWDVGIDNNDFEPVSFDEIKDKIKNNVKNILTLNNRYDNYNDKD